MGNSHIKKGKMPGMISCDESTNLISKKQDSRLNLLEKFQLWMHLMFCKFCRRYDKQIELIDRTIKTVQMRTNKKLSVQDKENIHRKVMYQNEQENNK